MRANGLISDNPGVDQIMVNGIEFKKGEKIKLKLGQRRSDVSDILMDGRVATIETIYTDYDDKIYLAVTIDDDPGQDIWRDMNIYRFFLIDEVEKINHGK